MKLRSAAIYADFPVPFFERGIACSSGNSAIESARPSRLPGQRDAQHSPITNAGLPHFEMLSFECFLAKRGTDAFAQQDEVLGGVAFAGTAVVFVEGYVQDPMAVVLDAPMAVSNLPSSSASGAWRVRQSP